MDYDPLDDDCQYATDLGLIVERDGKLTPANPICGEPMMRSQKTFEESKRQLSGYMGVLGCVEGWLVVFDRRKDVPWESKLF